MKEIQSPLLCGDISDNNNNNNNNVILASSIENEYREMNQENNVNEDTLLLSLNTQLSNFQIIDEQQEQNSILHDHNAVVVSTSNSVTNNDEDWGDPFPLDDTDVSFTDDDMLEALHHLNFDNNDAELSIDNDENNQIYGGNLEFTPMVSNNDIDNFLDSNSPETLPDIELDNLVYEMDTNNENDDNYFISDNIDNVFDDCNMEDTTKTTNIDNHNMYSQESTILVNQLNELQAEQYPSLDNSVQDNYNTRNIQNNMNIESEYPLDVLTILNQLENLNLETNSTEDFICRPCPEPLVKSEEQLELDSSNNDQMQIHDPQSSVYLSENFVNDENSNTPQEDQIYSNSQQYNDNELDNELYQILNDTTSNPNDNILDLYEELGKLMQDFPEIGNDNNLLYYGLDDDNNPINQFYCQPCTVQDIKPIDNNPLLLNEDKQPLNDIISKKNTLSVSPEQTDFDDNADTDETNDYFCQPCTTEFTDSAFFLGKDTIDQNTKDLEESVQRLLKLDIGEKDELLSVPVVEQQLVVNVNVNSNQNIESTLTVASNGKYSIQTDDQTEDEPEIQTVIVTKSLLASAQPFMKSFGSSLHAIYQNAIATNVDNSDVSDCDIDFTNDCANIVPRSCLGHKERILGCGFSPCGNYVASASQDSTVRIWNTSTNLCLSTISLDPKHEVLRVAWASQNWAEYRLNRSNVSSSENSSINPYAYLLATGGADGIVHVYGTSHPDKDDWTCYSVLDHSTYSHFDAEQANDAQDKPQIYSLQFIDHWNALPSTSQIINDDQDSDDTNSFLLTSSDDHIHLWEVDVMKKSKQIDGSSATQFHLREVFSLRFSDWIGHNAYGVSICQVTDHGIFGQHAKEQERTKENNDHDGEEKSNAIHDSNIANKNYFGGDRNPKKLIFVFDASYCSTNGLLGAAMSDGTLRLVNGRGICLSIMQLPGTHAHLTSFGWDSSGQRLATCVANGYLVLWHVENILAHNKSDKLRTTCSAILGGGHQNGKPLFGVKYVSIDTGDSNNEKNEDLIISWGYDGRICLWDSHAQKELDAPISILLHMSNYPIYAVSVTNRKLNTTPSSLPSNDDTDCLTIAVAGGEEQENGVSGIPMYLYDVKRPQTIAKSIS